MLQRFATSQAELLEMGVDNLPFVAVPNTPYEVDIQVGDRKEPPSLSELMSGPVWSLNRTKTPNKSPQKGHPRGGKA